MKKIFILLLLFSTMVNQAAFAVIFSINLGATSTESGLGFNWSPYNTNVIPIGTFQTYTDFEFRVTGGVVKPTVVNGAGFTGYSTYAGATTPLITFKSINVNKVDTYYLYAYSTIDYPTLTQLPSSSLGTINPTRYSYGTVFLGGQEYKYSAYEAHFGGSSSPYQLSGYYNTPLNAVLVSSSPVPEPASVILLGVGVVVASFVTRRKTSVV